MVFVCWLVQVLRYGDPVCHVSAACCASASLLQLAKDARQRVGGAVANLSATVLGLARGAVVERGSDVATGAACLGTPRTDGLVAGRLESEAAAVLLAQRELEGLTVDGHGLDKTVWHVFPAGSSRIATVEPASDGVDFLAPGLVRRTLSAQSAPDASTTEACARWQVSLDQLLHNIEGNLEDAYASVNAPALGAGKYRPRLRRDAVTIRDIGLCIPRLQVAGSLWPQAFFTLCRLVQSGVALETASEGEGAASSAATSTVSRVIGCGVNILRLIVGIRMRVGFLVHKTQRSGMLEAQEAAVRSALALLPLRGDGRLTRELRLLSVSDGDGPTVGQGFTLPSSLFKSRGGALAAGTGAADERYAHTNERQFVPQQQQAAVSRALEADLALGFTDVGTGIENSRAGDALGMLGTQDTVLGGDAGTVKLSADDLKELAGLAPKAGAGAGGSGRPGGRRAALGDALAAKLKVAGPGGKPPPSSGPGKSGRRGLPTKADDAAELVAGAAEGPSDATVHVDGSISFTPSKETIKELMKKV